MSKNRKHQGFTLVELSIVLVIIGLIVASVLVGQDLVRQAELRATVTQYEQYISAVGTFRGKYGGLPGDIKDSEYFALSNVADGDGDGLVEGSTSALANTEFDEEATGFWAHLGASGSALINGDFSGAALTTSNIADLVPKTKAGEYWGVSSDGISKNYLILGLTSPGAAGKYDTTGVMTGLEMFSFDSKIDDGSPVRGSVQPRDVGENNPVDTDGVSVTNCSDATSYLTSGNSTAGCMAIMLLSL